MIQPEREEAMRKVLTAVFLVLALWLAGTVHEVSAADIPPVIIEPEGAVDDQMQYLAGNWYDMNGNIQFEIIGRHMLCGVVTGGRNFIGSQSFGSGTFIMAYPYDKSGTLLWATHGEGNHSLLILEIRKGKPEVFRRSSMQKYTESVNGIYLGMTDRQVQERFGQPERKEDNGTEWFYPDQGIKVAFLQGVANTITITGEKARLDGSGLGLFSDDTALKDRYDLQSNDYPEAFSVYEGIIGSGEKLMVMKNPRAIVLTSYLF